MTQNIYDDPAFFQSYSRLPRSVEGLDAAGEWPAIRALLPDLAGRRVLDLGCGYGWFCRWARQHGAASVLGLDVSDRMLARARQSTDDPGIAYARADLENFAPGPDRFDLAYSSLVLHYIENLAALLAGIHAALAPGGRFVFSVEHPMVTAPAHPGWSPDPAGEPAWPVNRYQFEGPRTTNWLAEGVIKQHRTLATYLNLLLAAGFALARIDEWGPTAEQIAAHPDWAIERHSPPFLLVACRR
jgi:SAM-dependent methyltransferase